MGHQKPVADWGNRDHSERRGAQPSRAAEESTAATAGGATPLALAAANMAPSNASGLGIASYSVCSVRARPSNKKRREEQQGHADPPLKGRLAQLCRTHHSISHRRAAQQQAAQP